MKISIKIFLLAALFFFLLGYFIGDIEYDENKKHRVTEPSLSVSKEILSPKNISNSVREKEANKKIEYNNALIDSVNLATEITVDRLALLEMIGDNNSLEWEKEYNKGVYSEHYDLTWQDDMFNQSYELLLEEKYSDKLKMLEASCEKEECKFRLNKLSDAKLPTAVIASKYVLDLKKHPSILESGKQRNIYVDFVGNRDGENLIELSIR